MRVEPSDRQTITLAQLFALRRLDIIPTGRFRQAVWFARDATTWLAWARRTLLALGVGHLVAGIFFFFAANWQSLGALEKLGSVSAGIAVAAIAAVLVGLDRIVGAALLIVATLLTGLLLGVIGQIYQTGADAWTLFALWASLTLPFALASRSPWHWAVWGMIATLAVGLAADIYIQGPLAWMMTSWVAGVPGIVLLAAREASVALGSRWLEPAWTRVVPAAAAAVAVTLPAAAVVSGLDEEPAGLLGAIAILPALGGVAWLRLGDWRLTSVAIAAAAVIAAALGLRLVVDELNNGGIMGSLDEFALLLRSLGMAVWTAAVGVVAARLVRSLWAGSQRQGTAA